MNVLICETQDTKFNVGAEVLEKADSIKRKVKRLQHRAGPARGPQGQYILSQLMQIKQENAFTFIKHHRTDSQISYSSPKASGAK